MTLLARGQQEPFCGGMEWPTCSPPAYRYFPHAPGVSLGVPGLREGTAGLFPIRPFASSPHASQVAIFVSFTSAAQSGVMSM